MPEDRYRTIHIVSDGTPTNTRITDEAGVDLKGVIAFNIDMQVKDSLAEVTIQLWGTVLNVDGTVNEVQFRCPLCGIMAEHDCSNGIVRRMD